MRGAWWSMLRKAPGAVALLLPAATSHAQQSVTNPGGPQASRLNDLWWLNFWIMAGVYALVLLAGAIAAWRRRRGARTFAPEPYPNPRHDRIARAATIGAVAITFLLLVVLFAGDLFTGIKLHQVEGDPRDPLRVQITGHQWWWEVQYPSQDAQRADRIVRTANQIHIPTGRPVEFQLRSDDVIHSFWVPSLYSKKDLIPGHPTTVTLEASRPGMYTGQCAEYCGEQHAHMRFDVLAQDPAQFETWLNEERSDAPEPRTDREKHGREVFLSQTCMMCHTISGTTAQSRVGPDLTHVASRPYIASGSLPNTRGYLAGWIVDPQHLKPGARMPTQTLSPDDFRDLLDYLQTLK